MILVTMRRVENLSFEKLLIYWAMALEIRDYQNQ